MLLLVHTVFYRISNGCYAEAAEASIHIMTVLERADVDDDEHDCEITGYNQMLEMSIRMPSTVNIENKALGSVSRSSQWGCCNTAQLLFMLRSASLPLSGMLCAYALVCMCN